MVGQNWLQRDNLHGEKIKKEYMRKGFALDDERLKNLGGGGYFKKVQNSQL